jgi:hypothetical protein
MVRTTGIELNLPKPQRRGAILILGMLALSKKSVLTDKVDIMLKVGLGPLGKASIELRPDISFSYPSYRFTGRSNVGSIYMCCPAETKWQCEKSQR